MKQLTLEERKQISLEILLEINSICEKHHIPFFLAYGSLLGAVRHKGYIPWDDDIDIWVPSMSYKDFLKAMQEESKYEILDWRNKKNAWNDAFTKISDSRTVVTRRDGKPSPYRGVSVDVFPLMPIGDSKWIRDVMKSNRMIQRLIAFRFGLFLDSPLSIVRKLGCSFLLWLHKDEVYWNQRIETAVDSIHDATIYGCPISIYGIRDSFRRECFEETIILSFEGYSFPAPVQYDEVLRKLYHDYMTPPDEQVSNHDVVVSWRQ